MDDRAEDSGVEELLGGCGGYVVVEDDDVGQIAWFKPALSGAREILRRRGLGCRRRWLRLG